jgi:hypothetical protein
MIRTEDGDFTYTFEIRKIEDGTSLWHCEVCRRGEAVPLVTSINFTSGMAAREEARRAIERRYAA